ncbi:hypothetical protein AU374_00962 [Cupriavidus metallidurans]|nr:hypothetical protein AU374_00962 [Cupriavidus metallidurans]
MIVALPIYFLLLFVFGFGSRFKSTVRIKQCVDWHANRFQNRMREGYRCLAAHRNDRNSCRFKCAGGSSISNTVEHSRFGCALHKKSAIREECYGKLVSHVMVEPAIDHIAIHCSIQLGLHNLNSGTVDRNYRDFVSRSRQPSDLMEMSGLQEVGTMRRIGHLNAFASVFGERSKHLRKGLRLNRMLEKFWLLDRQANYSLGRGCT